MAGWIRISYEKAQKLTTEPIPSDSRFCRMRSGVQCESSSAWIDGDKIDSAVFLVEISDGFSSSSFIRCLGGVGRPLQMPANFKSMNLYSHSFRNALKRETGAFGDTFRAGQMKREEN